MIVAKSIGRVILVFLVSMSALFNVPALSSLVLCLGKDGHLEVEFAVEGKCGPKGEASPEASMHADADESHCGTCTDLSLKGSSGEAFRPVLSLDTFQSPALAAPTLFIAQHLDRATPGLLSLPPPAGSPHLPHLRTVRLLV